ncbi:cation transporter [Methylonatrum kenyense]|uniref:cation diffusion facilitator family transporter n=1 Tax=Methylonatrum kenyense TaxID=455253 RepID=UPI0020C136E2|nr:cation transporter [Methylonatrum kenyense]MCK8516352.1 cation transporter [Methylonatrum kenyense]
MRTERRALLLSAAAALLVGSVGVTVALVSNSRAILLDGMFNLTYFLVALVSVRVAHLAQQPGDEAFPRGYSYFEPLINAGKGLLILGVSAVALADSLAALVTGGREILAGLAIAYAAFATIACSVTCLLLYLIWRREPTPLIRADLENWLVNSVISASVLLAFALIPLAQRTEFSGITPYIDPVLVAAVVILCLGVPLKMAWRGIMELLDRAPPEHVTRPLRQAVDDVLAPLPVRQRYIRIVRPGRTVFVTAHVVLPEDFPVESLGRLDQIRHQLDTALRGIQPRLITDVLFTADERWAAPKSGIASR